MVNLETMAGEILACTEEVIFLYRTQNFYFATQKEITLIDKLSAFLKSMAEHGQASLCEQVQATLGEILNAKNVYNEVVLSDYYEALLIPAMHWSIAGLQEKLENISTYYEENSKQLQERFPQVYNHIKMLDIKKILEDTQYKIEKTNSGLLTLAVDNDMGKTVYLHSNSNPMTEATILAKEYYEEVDSVYRICGFGLGYFVEAMAEMDTTSQIIVHESNLDILAIAMYYMNLKNIWKEKRIQIIYDKDYVLFRKNMVRCTPVIHYPSLETLENLEVKEILKNYFIQLQSARNQKIYLEENFSRNIKLDDESVDVLRDTFKDKKMLLVAGGPSLDKCMEWIEKNKSEYIVVAVGTVLRKLCDYGIVPDYAIVTDANVTMIQQIENVDTKKIPLMYMVTSSYILRKEYKGKAYRILQKGWDASEDYAKRHGLCTYQTGGSVTTTALDIGISFGCEEILFMGMDMAYTGGASHAKGTNSYMKEQNNDRMISVKSVSGENVYTIRNLLIYRQWIENRIKDCENIRFVNVSDGAEVKGMENISVDIFLIQNL